MTIVFLKLRSKFYIQHLFLIDYQEQNGNPPPNTNYPSDYTVNSTGTSNKLYKLNATTNKTGLAFVIKVMAGDVIDIHGKSYYQSTQTFNNSNSTPLILTDIISALLGSPDNLIGSKGVSATQMESWNSGLIPGSFIRGSNGESVSVPKAYINYMFFDEQFNYAGGNFSRVGNSGDVKSHWFADAILQNIPVPKSGYLYVYVSNESNVDVFFDNLQAIHTRGRILEETHYYPFGLTMAGISSKAGGKLGNNYKFNGYEQQRQEFSDNTGLELYDYKHRFYDYQIGRFFCSDRLAGQFPNYSPYQFAGNNVPNAIDLDGLEPLDAKKNQTIIQASKANNHGQEIQVIYDPASIGNGTSKDGVFSIMNYWNNSRMYYWKNNEGTPGIYSKSTAKSADGKWTGYWQRYETYEERDVRLAAESARILAEGFYHIFTAPFTGATKGALATKFILNTFSEFGFNGKDADVADIFLGEIPYVGFLLEAALDYQPFASDDKNGFQVAGLNKDAAQTIIDLYIGGLFKSLQTVGKKGNVTFSIRGKQLTEQQMGIGYDLLENTLNKEMQAASEKSMSNDLKKLP